MSSEGLIKHRLQVWCKVVINQILERVNKEAAVLCCARRGAGRRAGRGRSLCSIVTRGALYSAATSAATRNIVPGNKPHSTLY